MTAATLALGPLLDAGLVEPAGLIVDAASGVSGAGRAATATNAFCTVDEDFVAYGLLDHRHTPEIEQNLSAQVLFTPHLAPMNRGILATCYGRPAAGDLTPSSCWPSCVRPTPTSRSSSSSTARRRPRRRSGRTPPTSRPATTQRTGTVIALCALDNLTKGASGGALQSANVALGLDETVGLPLGRGLPVTVASECSWPPGPRASVLGTPCTKHSDWKQR